MNSLLFCLIAFIGYVVSSNIKNQKDGNIKSKTPTGAILSTMM